MVLILVILLVLILVLVVLLILVLILILILILILVLVLVILLILHLLAGVDVVLLGIQVIRIGQKRLFEGIHGSGPVLARYGQVTHIEPIVGGVSAFRSLFLDGGIEAGSLIETAHGLLTAGQQVTGVREIVIRGQGGRVLQQGLAVIHVGGTVVFLFEIPVSGTYLAPVRLRERIGNGKQQQERSRQYKF